MLYRLFDGEGGLLYIGISDSPVRRWREHLAHRPWASEIASMALEDFSSRTEATLAEVQAIRAERPRHNLALARETARAFRTIDLELEREILMRGYTFGDFAIIAKVSEGTLRRAARGLRLSPRNQRRIMGALDLAPVLPGARELLRAS